MHANLSRLEKSGEKCFSVPSSALWHPIGSTKSRMSVVGRVLHGWADGSIVLFQATKIERPYDIIIIIIIMVRAANERSVGFYFGCLLWAFVCVVLVAWDFGVIAFCGSILLAIWTFGLREKFSNEETASAYSVFNQGGKAIVGGLTASQFDRQLRGGARSGSNEDNDPVRGTVAVATTSGGKQAKAATVPEDEKLRRRKAAAAAAERRLQ